MKNNVKYNIADKLEKATTLYNRLVLLVGSPGSGKTSILKEVASQFMEPIINVNLELSQRLVELPKRQRPLEVNRLFSEIVLSSQRDPVLLDNLELLFDPSLMIDPLNMLKKVSRNITVLATWNGRVENQQLVYAAPDHSEYRKYSVDDFLVVESGPDN